MPEAYSLLCLALLGFGFWSVIFTTTLFTVSQFLIARSKASKAFFMLSIFLTSLLPVLPIAQHVYGFVGALFLVPRTDE